MKPIPNHTLIELHVPDFQKVKDYYGRLGFEIVREDPAEWADGYLVLQMQDNILCFWAGNERVYEHSYFRHFSRTTKRGYGVEIILMVSSVERYYERVKDDVHVIEPLRLRPWGLQDFRVEDPFGYYIRITEQHNVVQPGQDGAV